VHLAQRLACRDQVGAVGRLAVPLELGAPDDEPRRVSVARLRALPRGELDRLGVAPLVVEPPGRIEADLGGRGGRDQREPRGHQSGRCPNPLKGTDLRAPIAEHLI